MITYIKNRFQLIRKAILNAAYYTQPQIEPDIVNRLKLYFVKQRYDDWAYHSTDYGLRIGSSSQEKIVVSLTTHGKRIMTVHRTIESLLQQSFHPDAIVLYIGEEEYQSIDQLPIVLQLQQKRGLDIRFVPDQGPYTKLLPALRDFPEAVVVTFDDDILYPVNAIERLYNAHVGNPSAICALEARQIEWKDSSHFCTYDSFPFPRDTKDLISPRYIAEGFGGVLYPPHCFPDEVFNRDLYMKLAPYADDLWYKAMSLVAQTPVLKVHDFFDFGYERFLDEDVQDVGLRNQNIDCLGNDRQLVALCDYFNLYDQLR